MKIDLSKKSPLELLIEEIEYKLTGRRYTDSQVLKDIEEGQADCSDINYRSTEMK